VVVVRTAIETLTSAEFCSARRWLAHLLTMYGFLAYVATTLILVFGCDIRYFGTRGRDGAMAWSFRRRHGFDVRVREHDAPHR
jgi:hypothetical protein